MGPKEFCREEGPVRNVTVGPFLIDRTEVTNAEFAAFVAAADKVTTSDRPLDVKLHPDWPDELLMTGSMVFAEPPDAVDLSDVSNWKHYVRGADRRHPNRPGSSIGGLENHQVVQVFPRIRRGRCRMGGCPIADRGGMRICRTRRPVRGGLCLARGVQPIRGLEGEHLGV